MQLESKSMMYHKCIFDVNLLLCFFFVTSYKKDVVAPNVALMKTATQSSTLGTHDAKRAIDGNTDANSAGNSCAQTGSMDEVPYWMVDLGGDYKVDTVYILVCVDCAAGGLSGVNIEMGRMLTSMVLVVSDFDVTDSRTFNLRDPRTTRYIKISKPSSPSPTSLALCEVEVYGYQAQIVQGYSFFKSNYYLYNTETFLNFTVRSSIQCAIECLQRVCSIYIVSQSGGEVTCEMSTGPLQIVPGSMAPSMPYTMDVE